MPGPMQLKAQDFNPAAYAPKVSPFFGMLPPELWSAIKDFFVYSTSFIPLAASATVTNNIAIQADSDFLAVGITGSVFDSPAQTTVVANPPQLVQIVDAGSGRAFFNEAQQWNNVVGTAQNPFLCPMPKLVRANSTISITLQNLDAANARVSRVALIGFKLFMGMAG